MNQVLFNWGPAIAGLALVGLTGCAEIMGTNQYPLRCNAACTPAMWAAQDRLQLEPVRYAELFGTEWVAGVSVDGKSATSHMARAGK